MLDPSSPRFRLYSPMISRLRGRLGRVGFRILLALALIFYLRGCMMSYIPPDEIGLRQIAFGPNKGLQNSLVGSGYRREISGYETLRTFPRDIQIIEFTDHPAEGSDRHRVVGAIAVPTVDGYPVSVDVTVLYRIADPFLVTSKFGFGQGYEDNVVIRFTDPAVKHHLGELRAEFRIGMRHQNRMLRLAREILLNVLQDTESVFFRQHEIEQNEIIGMLFQKILGLVAVRRLVGLHFAQHDEIRDQISDERIMVDDQYVLRHVQALEFNVHSVRRSVFSKI